MNSYIAETKGDFNFNGCRSHRSAIDDVLFLENPIENGRICEDNEAKATWLAGVLLSHDGGVDNIAVVAEMVSQLILRRVPRNPSNKKLALIRIHHPVSILQ